MTRRGSSLGRSVLDLDVDDSRFHSKLSGARIAAQKWTSQTGTDLMKAGKALSGVGESWTRNVTLPIVGAGVATGKLAFDFDKTMNQIVALTSVGQDQIGAFREEILALAPAVGKGPQELAEAFYFVASAGFEGAEAMEILRHTAKAAAAGLGDTATVAKVIGSAVNAYGLEAKDAAGLTDQLVAAIGEGSAEAPEFAGALGNVIGSAAQIGASFSDVTGAIAAMTNVGIGAEEAVTSLNQVFVTLMKPTAGAAAALEEMGYTAEGLRESIRERGLMPTLGDLAVALEGDAEATAEVFGNVRALRGVLALTGPQLEETAALIDRVADSTGATGEAFDQVAKSDSFKLEQAMAALQATAIEFGADVLPLVVAVLERLADGAQSLAEWWDTLDDGTKELIVNVLAFTAAVGPALLIIGKLTAGLGMLFKAVGFLASAKGIPALTKHLGTAGLLGVLLAVAVVGQEASKAFGDFITEVIHGKEAAMRIRDLRTQLEELGGVAGPLAKKLDELGVSSEEMARVIEAAGGDTDKAVRALIDNTGNVAGAIVDLQGAVDDLDFRDADRQAREFGMGLSEGLAAGATEAELIAAGIPPEMAATLAAGAEDVRAGAGAAFAPTAEEAAKAREAAVAHMKAMLSGIAGLFDADTSLRDAFNDLLDRMDDPYTEAERRADIFSTNTISVIRGALKAGDPLIVSDTKDLVDNMLGQIEAMEPGALATGEAVPKKLREGMDRQVSALITWINENTTGPTIDELTIEEADEIGVGNLKRYAEGMERARREQVAHALNSLQSDLRTQTSISLWQSGYNAVTSMADGMNAAEWRVFDAAWGIGNTLRGGLAIYSEPAAAWSPLRGITKWGGNIVDTIAAGILGEHGVIPDALRRSLAGDMLAVPEIRTPWSSALDGATHPYSALPALDPAGADSLTVQYVLNVAGVPQMFESKEEWIKALEDLSAFGGEGRLGIG